LTMVIVCADGGIVDEGFEQRLEYASD
jgi:hypothetical protein